MELLYNKGIIVVVVGCPPPGLPRFPWHFCSINVLWDPYLSPTAPYTPQWGSHVVPPILGTTYDTYVYIFLGVGYPIALSLLHQHHDVYSGGPPATPPPIPHHIQVIEPLSAVGPGRLLPPLLSTAHKLPLAKSPPHGRGGSASRPSSWRFFGAPPC